MTTDVDPTPFEGWRAPGGEGRRAPTLPTWIAERLAIPEPWHLLERAAAEDRWWAWHDGETGLSAVAGGAVATVDASSSAVEALRSTLRERWPQSALDVPAMIGGWAFGPECADADWSDFGTGSLWVPRWVCATDGEATVMVRDPAVELRALAPRVATEACLDWSSEPDRDGYRALVETGLEAIARGDVAKIVLARRVSGSADADLSPAATLRALRAAHPRATTFAVGCGDAAFVGATPETLVRLRGGYLESHAVAGTLPAGRDPAQLSGREKDVREHAHVVRHIVNTFGEVAREVRVGNREPRPAGPVVHLVTPIRGIPRTSLVEAAHRLHPTPALAGSPARRAASWLRELEPFERGWYGAPVGWLSPRGEGHFAVAIRSALLRGRVAHAYVGAGIVAGSDPAAEWEETEHKLRSVVPFLRAGGRR